MIKIFYSIKILLFVTLCLHSTSIAASRDQFFNPDEFSRNIINDLNTNNLDINGAAQRIEELGTNFSKNTAFDFLEKLNETTSMSTEQKIDLLSTGINGSSTQGFADIDLRRLKGIISNFEVLGTAAETIEGFVGNLKDFTITPQMATTLSAGLGSVTTQLGLENLLQNVNIANDLKGMLENGDIAKLPDAIGAISGLLIDPQQLQDMGIEAATQFVTDALQNALPDVSAELIAAFGADALQEQIEDALASLGSTLGGALGSLFGGGGSNGPCQCKECKGVIEGNHEDIREHMTSEMEKHRDWLSNVLFKDHILKAMGYMSSQLSAVAMRHTYAVGRFFDAKHQLETQRTMQILMAKTHKDYQPSESLCEIGGFTQSLSPSKRLTDYTQVMLTTRGNDRQRKDGDIMSAGGENVDGLSRIDTFINKYCDVNDNQKGLTSLCTTQNEDGDDQVTNNVSRKNKDINFTRTLLANPTITTEPEEGATSPDTDLQDVLAMMANVVSFDLVPDMDQLILATEDGKPREAAYNYMNLRSTMAMHDIEQNTFAAIAAERVSGSPESASRLKGLMTELGMEDFEAEALLGKNPSYYAQRKVLSNYAFENARFYTELYESPTNTDRKSVALKAINLMLEDDFYDRQLESEMALAVMLETMLYESHVKADSALTTLRPREN